MECTTDNVEQFKEIIEWLRDNDRKAMVSESGASLDESVSRQRLSMLLSGGTELTSPRSA
jgi:hypothetical protein